MEQITNDDNYIRPKDLELEDRKPLISIEEDIPKNSDELLRS
jgi:hypothetical protein